MFILKQLNTKKETQNKELFTAISQNDIEIVKDLINKGANVNSIHDDTENGIIEHCTCLYCAVKEGYSTISSKIYCSDKIIKFLQKSINHKKDIVSLNIIDFKTGRIINL